MASRGTTLVSRRLTALSRALADLAATVEAGGLYALDDRQLVEFLQEFEAVRNRMPVVHHGVLREVAGRDLAT